MLMREDQSSRPSSSPMHRKNRGRRIPNRLLPLFLLMAVTWNDVHLETLSPEQQCNRTFYGEVGLKYPLRFSEPVQRFHPFLCDIAFAPVGGRTGDIIELTFLSFQVGSYGITKDENGNGNCQNGHLTIREPRIKTLGLGSGNGTAEGTFCGQMMARKAIYYSEGNNLSLAVYLPPARAFYGHSLPFSLFFTYRFLTSRTPPESTTQSHQDLLTDFGVKSSQTYCDRVFDNCLPPRRCRIRSPNYPGFYPRNITCHFYIRQMNQVPAGHRARIIVSQANENKISVYSGSSAIGSSAASPSLSKANRGPQTDCPTDVIRIHDGWISSNSSMIAEFCGSGHLPAVRSSGPELLVTLFSAPQSVMYDSRIELDVQVELMKKEENETVYRRAGSCDYVYDGSAIRGGLISSPSYSLPSNTSCSYMFHSNRPEDRIWFFFASYYVQDLNEWGNEERCDLTELQLQGVLDAEEGSRRRRRGSACNQTSPLRSPAHFPLSSPADLSILAASPAPSSPSSSSSRVYRFCEKSSPRVCGRASDSSSLQPATPCSFPEESYLSSAPQMTIKQHHYKPTAFYSGSGSFIGRFEFVDMKEFGDPVDGTLCDRWIFSHKQSRGEIKSSRNTFHFGRGGQSSLSCSFHFVGKKNERLRLRFTSVRLDSSHCRHSLDPRNGMFSCHKAIPDRISEERTGTLAVMDSIKSEQITVGCFCSDGEKRGSKKKRGINKNQATDGSSAFTFDLIGPEVIVNLTVIGMKGTDDFNNFGFEASYEFWPGYEICSSNAVVQKKDGKEGEVVLSVPSSRDLRMDPVLKCRWLIQGSQGKHLYLKFRGFVPKLDEDCRQQNHYVIYSGNPWRATATVCVSSADPQERLGNHPSSSERDQDVDLFSSSWYNKSRSADQAASQGVGHGEDLSARDADPAVVRLLIEFLVVQPPPTSLSLKWLEVTKPFESTGESLKNIDCMFKCPELNACISPDLWCDGITHCPSGYDELSQHCSSFNFLWIFTITGTVLVVVSAIAGTAFSLKFVWKRRRRHQKEAEGRHEAESEIPFHLDQGSFRSTYLRPGAISVALSSSNEGSSEQDFLPSEREFDFRGFRDTQTMRHERRDREAINGRSYATAAASATASSTLTRSTALSSPFTTYNPYERTAFVHYYQRNVF